MSRQRVYISNQKPKDMTIESFEELEYKELGVIYCDIEDKTTCDAPTQKQKIKPCLEGKHGKKE